MGTSTNTISGRKKPDMGRGVPKHMAQLKDSELLLAVRTGRDALAFSEFHNRHLKSSFNVAKFITRNHEQAEEAVQEAMFIMWQSSESISEGKERAWLMKIVANLSLRKVRDKRRKAGHVENISREKYQTEAIKPGQTLEHAEMINAMRSSMHSLSKEERHLVTLYFVAGLSQAEMSKSLEISQASISLRLKKIIQRIKTQLIQAGVASGSLIDWNASLNEAVISLESIPHALQQKLTMPLEQHVRQAAGKKPMSGPFTRAIPVALLLSVIASGALYALKQTPQTEHTTARPTLIETPQAIKPAAGLDFDDHFESKTLNPFWKTMRPPQYIYTAGGKNNSHLELEAVNMPKHNPSSQPKITEITSKRMMLNGVMSMIFKCDSIRPVGLGKVEYGFEIKNELGQSILKQGYKANQRADGAFGMTDFLFQGGKRIPTHYGKKYYWRMSPFSFSGFFTADPKKDDTAKKVFSFRKSVEPGDTRQLSGHLIKNFSSLTIRLYVIAHPNSAIRWPFDRVRIRTFEGDSGFKDGSWTTDTYNELSKK